MKEYKQSGTTRVMTVLMLTDLIGENHPFQNDMVKVGVVRMVSEVVTDEECQNCREWAENDDPLGLFRTMGFLAEVMDRIKNSEEIREALQSDEFLAYLDDPGLQSGFAH